MFADTGLEYPEIRSHVKEFAEHLRKKYNIEVVLDIVRPKMRFDAVIKKYGYPMISKEVSECIKQARKSLRREDGAYTYRLMRLKGELRDKNGNKSVYNVKKYQPLLYTDFMISNECCMVMKKNTAKTYEKKTKRKPILAQLACEGKLRKQQWIRHGCNGFDMSRPVSNPMSFWLDQDILEYHKKHDLPLCSVYGEIEYANNPDQLRIEDFGVECECHDKLCMTGCDRTGCIFCGFGCHLDKSPSRFERLKETHPKQYDYCIGGGEYVWKGERKGNDGIWREFDLIADNGEPMTELESAEFMELCKNIENFRFTRVWQPNKQGLGMGHVFDELNKIYGDGFIKY